MEISDSNKLAESGIQIIIIGGIGIFMSCGFYAFCFHWLQLTLLIPGVLGVFYGLRIFVKSIKD